RNSSPSTSPGCVVTRLGVAIFLVVVDDFDIGWTLLRPDKADAPLIVDADRMLPAAIPCQRFEAGAGRRAQIRKDARVVEHIKLAQSLILDAREPLNESPHPQALGGSVTERLDHALIMYAMIDCTSSV